MEDDNFQWSEFMVQLPWSDLQTKRGPRRMTMHQKVNVMIFLIHAQKGQY